MSINEKEFYQRGFFDKIADYKLSMVLITLGFILLTVIYLLFATKLYNTDATVEITPKYDSLDSTLSEVGQRAYEGHYLTQIDFLQSRYLLSYVVNKLRLNVNYYEENKLLSYVPIIGESPFVIKHVKIKDSSFYNKMFEIKLVDENHYELSIISASKLDRLLAKFGFKTIKKHSLIYPFSKEIKSRYFDLLIEKNRFSSKNSIIFNVMQKRHAVDQLLGRLTIVPKSTKSRMIEINYMDTNPIRAEKVLNSFLEVYLELNIDKEVSKSDDFLDLIKNELILEKKKLENSEKKLQKFIENNRVSGIDTQTDNIVNSIYDYTKKLEILELKKNRLDSMYKLFRQSNDYKNILLSASSLKNENLLKLVDSLKNLEKEYIELRKKYKDKHPYLQKIKKSMFANSTIIKNNLKIMVENNQKEIFKVKSFLEKYKNNLGEIPKRELGYIGLKREHDLIEKNYLFLFDKQIKIKMSRKEQGAYEYRIVDYAFKPEFPSKPKKAVLLALGTVLGIIFALMYALFRSYMAKIIRVPAEVEELTTLPYLGTIPYIDNKKLYNDLFVSKDPYSMAAQMMWSLRARIDSVLEYKDGSKIIAVSSMVKGEGKTTLAANLAVCFGLGDKKTVILGLDFRLPELHTKFGLDNNVGMSSVLFDSVKFSDVIYSSDRYPNLHVVPSGSRPDNPAVVINSNRIDELLIELRKKYDYIVFDLPPIGVAAESLFLMQKSDLVLGVLKANYSEKSFVPYIENIASKHNIKNIGFVLNGVNKKYIKIVTRKENRKYLKHHEKFNTQKTESPKNMEVLV